MPKKVMIIGSFSGNNYGDNIVLLSNINMIKKVVGEDTIFIIPTTNPQFVKKFINSDNIEAIDISLKRTMSFRFVNLSIFKKLNEIDIIITTAGIFFDQKLWDPRFNFISSLMPLLIYAKYLGKNIVGVGIGIKSHSNIVGRYFLRKCLSLHDIIITRDLYSFNYLKNFMDDKKIFLKADIVHHDFKEECNEMSSKEYFGINIASYINGIYSDRNDFIPKDRWIKSFSQILEYIIKKYKIIFISTSKSDFIFHNEILQNFNSINIKNINLCDYQLNEISNLFDNVKLTIASRMHYCIISTSLNIPTIALTYHPKVDEYMNSINMGEYISTIEKLDVNDIILLIDKLEKNENKIRKQLRKNIEKLKSASSDTIHILESHFKKS